MGKLYWNRFCENVWEGRRFFQWCVGGWNPNHTLPEFCCQDDDFGAPKAHEFDRCNLDVLPLSWCSTWRCLIAMSLARGWQQLRIFGILQIHHFSKLDPIQQGKDPDTALRICGSPPDFGSSVCWVKAPSWRYQNEDILGGWDLKFGSMRPEVFHQYQWSV